MSVAEHNQVKEMSGNTRVGPFQRRYGWLASTYWPDSGFASSNSIRARTQHWWGRFN
ncbi:MAG: hypothetical protein ACR2KP_06850 [Egibacteraceae bacterium]